MRLDGFVLSVSEIIANLHCILPNSDISVFSTGIDSSGCCIEKNIVHWTLVTNELEGSQLRLETPYLDNSICSS